MVMDETLYQVQAKVQNFAVIYLGKSSLAACNMMFEVGLMAGYAVVDITKVPDFNKVSLVSGYKYVTDAGVVDVRIIRSMYSDVLLQVSLPSLPFVKNQRKSFPPSGINTS